MDAHVINIPYFVVPGGLPLKRKRQDDAGTDAYVCAIVELQGNKIVPVWDLTSPPEGIGEKARFNDTKGVWTYLLEPGEEIFYKTGVIFGSGTRAWYAELRPRSSGVIKNIEIKDRFCGVPIDSNFRGVPTGTCQNIGKYTTELYHGVSFSQFIFYCRCCRGGFLIPNLVKVSSTEELGLSDRGKDWNGSSNPIYSQPVLI